MKSFFFFFLIILIAIISNQEQNNSIENITKPLEQTISSNSSIINQENKTTNININNTNNKTQTKKNQRKYRRPPPIRSTSKIPNDTSHLNNNDVYSLNDLTFDMVLKGGNNYKWLVILYSETCGHCEHARREIRKVFPSYKNSTSIRFAEIEINKNYLTNMRFDIEGVPYIFMLQNNSIYELDLFPSSKNLKNFIDTDFKDIEEELKPFPSMVPAPKIIFVILSNILRGITNAVNDLLYDYGYDFEFTPSLLIITFILGFSSICILQFVCCAKFCPDEEKPKKKKKKKSKKKIEKEKEEKERKEREEREKKEREEKMKNDKEEEDGEEEEEDDEDEENESDKKKIKEEEKESEEEKKKIEREKEKEKKNENKIEKKKKKKSKKMDGKNLNEEKKEKVKKDIKNEISKKKQE